MKLKQNIIIIIIYIFGILNIFIIMIEYSMPIYMREGGEISEILFQKLPNHLFFVDNWCIIVKFPLNTPLS